MLPPIARKALQTKTLFGITLQDDYAWMQDRNNPEVLKYLKEENEYHDKQTAHTKVFQEKLYKEMLGRIKEDDSSVPYKYRNYFYYSRTEVGKEYPIHCRKKVGPESAEEIILDENVLAEGHEYFDLGDLEVSPNEQLLAYTLDINGSERYVLHVVDLATRQTLSDQASDMYGEIEWGNDNATIYYVTLEEGTHRPYRLYRHRFGDEGPDELMMEEPDDAFFLNLSKSADEKYLFVDLESTITTELLYFSADDSQAKPILFWERHKGIEITMDHHEGYWYVVTNEQAVNFKLMRVRVDAPAHVNWEEVIPHDAQRKIDGIEVFQDHLVVSGRKNGLHHMEVRHFRTGEVHTIEFPEQVYTLTSGANVEYDTAVLRLRYTSMVTPVSVYDYHMDSREKILLKRQEVLGGYNPDDYDSTRLFATAHDGTQIPISLVWKKSSRLKGPMPLYLYAYGSYGLSIDPTFSSSRLVLMDRGMVFAIAHIRGGGEMGRPWYESGKFLNKKNTFTDFIACAEHLIREGWTASDRLAIAGGSAGGLLMGAVLNLRPDLFRVAEAHVPFVDVMNTMLDPNLPLTVIEYDEWGDPNEERFFTYMATYSPYDNVDSRPWPDLLITAGLNDPRVQYWEPAKWCAKLRQMKPSDSVIYLKTNMGAGHQGASGRYGALRELAMEHAFVLDRLGLREADS
jgi:oligopeptidase B